jgi:2,3-bisphosphoglycerate-independent phosphoglycerate mutase
VTGSALIIIDGWGYSPRAMAMLSRLPQHLSTTNSPRKYPQHVARSARLARRLPAGVMGNSEVGHLNIGSGRVIRMDVSLVDHEIETGEFFNNKGSDRGH